jgi:hypothetical protein
MLQLLLIDLCFAVSTHPLPLEGLPRLKQAGATGITLDARYDPMPQYLPVTHHRVDNAGSESPHASYWQSLDNRVIT